VPSAAKCIFSVDVEDWFHILDTASTPALLEWDALPSRVEDNFERLLEIFEEKGIRVTCFFLGWVARTHPRAVKQAQRFGHELASHGYAHRLVYTMTPKEFLEDAMTAKKAIEDCAGEEVAGYRASGFSVTRSTSWFFEKLVEAGYHYDSSVFPGSRGHGGMSGGAYSPYRIHTAVGELTEFPITLTRICRTPVCLFGGGYLRLAPWGLIRRRAERVLGMGRPVVFYLHPREIDPDQPRLDMGLVRRFKSYVNLATTEEKLRKILSTFEFTTFRDYLEESHGFQNTPATIAVGQASLVRNKFGIHVVR
jgi:polysaccharide deacetylase family protein (PEP-CTERM system associated)